MFEFLTQAMQKSSSPTGWTMMALGLILYIAAVLGIALLTVFKRKNATIPILIAFLGALLVIVGRMVQWGW